MQDAAGNPWQIAGSAKGMRWASLHTHSWCSLLAGAEQAASYFLFCLFFAEGVPALRIPLTTPEMDYQAEDNRKADHDDERQDRTVTETHPWLLAMSIWLPPTFW
jgi:hypothetical protein